MISSNVGAGFSSDPLHDSQVASGEGLPDSGHGVRTSVVPSNSLATVAKSLTKDISDGEAFLDDLLEVRIEEDSTGGMFLGGLKAKAERLREDTELMAQVGAVVGDGSDPERVIAGRALLVELRNVANKQPPADAYLAEQFRAGVVTLDQFVAMTNDSAFRQELGWQVDSNGVPDWHTAARYVDRAAQNVAAGKLPSDDPAGI